jgi:hypothetical protein
LLEQIAVKKLGNNTVIGLLYIQTFFILPNPVKAFLLKETIWFVSKDKFSKLLKPINVLASIDVNLLSCK